MASPTQYLAPVWARAEGGRGGGGRRGLPQDQGREVRQTQRNNYIATSVDAKNRSSADGSPTISLQYLNHLCHHCFISSAAVPREGASSALLLSPSSSGAPRSSPLSLPPRPGRAQGLARPSRETPCRAPLAPRDDARIAPPRQGAPGAAPGERLVARPSRPATMRASLLPVKERREPRWGSAVARAVTPPSSPRPPPSSPSLPPSPPLPSPPLASFQISLSLEA